MPKSIYNTKVDPVKLFVSCFKTAISIPLHGLGVGYTVKPVKSVIIMHTSQKNKPLHHTVGSLINPEYLGILLLIGWREASAEIR